MNLNSIWFSLGPLIGFNIILLITVFIFRRIYREKGREADVENRSASPLLNKWMREYWYWLTDPFVRFFIRFKFSPNMLTFMGVLISMISGSFFWAGRFGLGGWFLIFAATFDMFDGRVARMTHGETKSGAYFDAVMDRASEGAVFLGLALHYRNQFALWIVFLALMGSFMVSYSRAKGEASGAAYRGGFMQRPERVVYLGVGAIFAPVFACVLNAIWFHQTSFIPVADNLYLFPLSFVALMTWVTSFGRIRTVMKMLDQSSQ